MRGWGISSPARLRPQGPCAHARAAGPGADSGANRGRRWCPARGSRRGGTPKSPSPRSGEGAGGALRPAGWWRALRPERVCGQECPTLTLPSPGRGEGATTSRFPFDRRVSPDRRPAANGCARLADNDGGGTPKSPSPRSGEGAGGALRPAGWWRALRPERVCGQECPTLTLPSPGRGEGATTSRFPFDRRVSPDRRPPESGCARLSDNDGGAGHGRRRAWPD